MTLRGSEVRILYRAQICYPKNRPVPLNPFLKGHLVQRTLFIGLALLIVTILSTIANHNTVSGAEDNKKPLEFVFDDYAITCKIGKVKEYDDTVHYRECADLTIYYNATLGIVESCEIREVDIGADKGVTVIFAKLKLANGTVTFCEWPIGKFVDTLAEKKKTKPNVRLYLADPPRKITLVPRGKAK